MGILVNAKQAAQLVNRDERIVRWHLRTKRDLPAEKVGHAWLIDTDDLERVPGWHVDRKRLARLAAQPLVAGSSLTVSEQLDALRQQVDELRALVRALSLASVSVSSSARPAVPPPAPREAQAFSMTYTAPAAGGAFRTRADAGRWLMRHGIHSEGTPKTWPGWRDVVLEPRAVLQLALSLYDPAQWRITWRLHRCDDPACVCRELLGD